MRTYDVGAKVKTHYAICIADHSVIPATVKTPGNKFAGIIMSGINMVAVKTPDKKFAQYKIIYELFDKIFIFF